MKPRSREAFTLVEIVIVIAILVSIAALGIPMLQGTLAQYRLKTSADKLRGEFLDARVKAMEEGQIFCLRCQLDGSTLLLDRVLDTHFTAGLSSRQTLNRYYADHELDPFEKGGFTGDAQDFILRDPSQASEENGTTIIKLPESVVVADVTTVPDERSAFYIGLTNPGNMTADDIEENASESEEITNQNLRLGETFGSDGSQWSTPIFFYPDGTTSTTTVILKNEANRSIEIQLRGLTGITTASEIGFADEMTR